jgi:hypothetical protein
MEVACDQEQVPEQPPDRGRIELLEAGAAAIASLSTSPRTHIYAGGQSLVQAIGRFAV